MALKTVPRSQVRICSLLSQRFSHRQCVEEKAKRKLTYQFTFRVPEDLQTSADVQMGQ